MSTYVSETHRQHVRQKNSCLLGCAMRALCRAIGYLAILALTNPVAASKPVVSDTGYEMVHMILTPSLHWVDSNRLLFAGIKNVEKNAAISAKEIDRVARLKKLYVWDSASQSVRLHADAQSVCFSKGFVSYIVRADKVAKKQIVREGLFGFEKELVRALPSKEEISAQEKLAPVRSNFTCKTHRRAELVPPARRDRNIVVLHEGDGYLELGPNLGSDVAEKRAHARNLTIFQATTGKATPLPMTWDEDFSPTEVVYSTYRGAYVLRPRKPGNVRDEKRRIWSRDFPPTVHLLWSDGRTETISIPYLPSEYVTHPQLAKAGWIFGGGNFYKAAGLYLFDGQAVQKIDVGLVKEIAVAPDGCRAAVGIQNRHLDMGTPVNIRIFEFCSGGR